MHIPFLSSMLLATLILLVIALLTTERLIRRHHRQKVDFFNHNPIQPGDIVFLGDSITDGARWHELFPDLPVRNRGINADTTSGVFNRLGDITAGQPAAVCLLIGTNDLPWFLFRQNADIIDAHERILKRLQSETPQTKVFVQSILPRERRYAKRILALNNQLESLAGQYGCTYINLFPHFASPNGGIRPDFTNDNLHLMAAGYACWVEILKPHLYNLKHNS